MPHTTFCVYCGARLRPGDRFCANCGKPVPLVEGETVSAPQPLVCPSCGARLEEGQRFCTACGASVGQAPGPAEPRARTEAEPPTAAQPPAQAGARAEARVEPREASPDDSLVMPTVAMPQPAPAEVPAQPDPPAVASPARPTTGGRVTRHEPSQRTIVIVCACVIAASAVAIAASLLLTERSGSAASDDAPVQATEEPAQPEEAPATDGQDTTDAETDADDADQQDDAAQAAAQADAAFHDVVKTYYDALPGYSDQIAEVASAFNSTYLTDDLAIRQANYQEASSLLSEIVSQRTALASTDAPEGTAWESQRQQVLTCYDYLAARLQCMVDAWGIDVAYANPSDHQAEILAPIQAGDDTDNHNLAKKEYEALYPQVQL